MIAQGLLPEVGHELANTRKLLERVPFDKFDWKPHEKSMTLGKLATHIANIPSFTTIILTTSDIDFSKGVFAPVNLASTADLVALFDKNAGAAKETLTQAPDEEFVKMWQAHRGEHVLFTFPKMAAMRSFAISHLVHHRAQLQVYLRMLDIPVPGFYGPSADEV